MVCQQKQLSKISQECTNLMGSFVAWPWSIIVMLLCIYLIPISSTALNSEGYALLDFVSNAAVGESGLEDWNSSHTTPCHWTGIQCSNEFYVLVINLADRKLRGNLTLDTSKFKWLQALNLSTNHLESEIPSHWGCSRSLKKLGLLQNLVELDLSNNQLQGAIPSSLNQLTQLLTLNLSMNHLQGLLPQGGVLSSLSIASYQLNNLCGLPITLACDTRRSIAENTDTTINAASPVVFAVSKSSGVQFVKNKKLSIVVIVIVCVATLAISKLFLGGLWYWRRTRQRNVCEIKLSGGKVVLFQMAGKPNLSTTVLMEKIEKLTAEDIIGTGGFGTVYRLVLDDQTALAVKKLIRGIDRDRGFERELEALADLKHKNLVTLRGHYSAPNINILLYDLVGNGSLDTWLYEYEAAGLQPLDWDTRAKIGIGAARGLAYLHHDCVPRIIHRDVKSSNILLDADLEARVSDFGLAKLMDLDKTHVTTMVAGTLGFLAPEYVATGLATEKVDIYSFGVVLLELVTGRHPCDNLFKDSGISLPQSVRNMIDEKNLAVVLDGLLVGTCPDEEVAVFVDTALFCTSSLPSHRPSMAQVVKMLEGHQSSRPSIGNDSIASSSHKPR
ncbi:receptor-like serine/threonine-protein kinase At1g78530 isoform X5 [Physcomitrium patens]|uniref:receptor-like serine/threonine-protein kinase At1g78530 isoform X5 n=1 Tax=Physcomitrium patens TaxID=3218 RepID=UPI000D154833|nr:receptor-like serine/threonine-protein kinase At1g78530 isoform X5 [Physcomitrium patens]|eukprot:XP_024379054.1 receptor-like serine/threonine-protein kinase At1g78530 isoform X5 [Physcomitrella patens]